MKIKTYSSVLWQHGMTLAISGIMLCFLISCGGEDTAWKSLASNDWTLEEGAEQKDKSLILVSTRSKAYYHGKVRDASFGNFRFKAEIKAAENAKALMSFHFNPVSGLKGYEVIINNNHHNDEWRKTGSLSSVRNVYKSMAKDNEWFPLEVEVVGNRISVWVNGIQMVDYAEPPTPWRSPEHSNKVISAGTFMFENTGESGGIEVRNIEVRPYSQNELAGREPVQTIDESSDPLTRLQQRDFPVIDYHVHLKGGWTAEQAAENSRKEGIFYGMAVNCGVGFPVQDDRGLLNYLDSMKTKPFFTVLQAEGREWMTLVSMENVKKFDYVFSDAMTFTDRKGRRTRLWMPDEVWVEDEEVFMDTYVEKIEGVIRDEPIDIYVNPTFLPAVIADKYDQLWTEDRMRKVIAAALDKNVAIEINTRYRIPSEKFILLAKEMGAKFAFGTNNLDPNIGRLEYCFEMAEKCGLEPGDMFMPEVRNR
ncbi:MAG: DUF1080 domain-containing protein [Cyclobacteriaceae bacterium]|nr:DUF1080 domain-containing protein [Cyclobacteriaceae bacterium]